MDKPIWSPGPERIERANINRFMRFVREETGNADINSYTPLWQLSVNQPERFWTLVWDFCGIRTSGSREPVRATGDDGRLQWFPAVRLSFVQNLLRFDDERTALTRLGDDGTRISHAELRGRIAALAALLRDAGVAAGDRVVAALDPHPDAIVAALATASLGAIWLPSSAATPIDRLRERFTTAQPAFLFGTAATFDPLRQALDGLRGALLIGDAAAAPAEVRLDARIAGYGGATLELPQFDFDQALIMLPGSAGDATTFGAGGTLMQHLKELVLHADLKREDKILIAAPCGSTAWAWSVSAVGIGATQFLADPAIDPQRLWDAVDECAISVVIADSSTIERLCEATLQPRESHKLLALKTVIAVGAPLSANATSYLYREVKERLYVATAVIDDGTVGCNAFGVPVMPVTVPPATVPALGMPDGDPSARNDPAAVPAVAQVEGSAAA